MEFEKLSIENESKRFHDHLHTGLTDQNNERIIFSGKFGIGKTYFIDRFFKDNEDVISIKLNPVNYALSSNEDIFELIKFDIAFQLFEKNPTYEKVDINKNLATSHYLLQNYRQVIKSLIKHLSKIDHRINALVEPVLDLEEKIEEFREKNKIDDTNKLLKFLETFTLQKGTYKEENEITELIFFLIETLKTNNEKKKIILIIDDLDRIDPEHIFRILNIFSSHYNFHDRNDDNKFGFDNVILICDIQNVRNIFKNRYGADTDFSGYIDKFYSSEIFHYNFSSVIVENLNKFSRSISTDHAKLNEDLLSSNKNYYNSSLELVLKYLILSNAISMRTLINFLNKKYTHSKYHLKIHGNNKLYSQSTAIFGIFDLIENLIGGNEDFINGINQVIKEFPFIKIEIYNDFWEYRIGNLLMLINHKEHSFKTDGKLHIYCNKDLDLRISYKIKSDRMGYGAIGHVEQSCDFADTLEEKVEDLNPLYKFKQSVFPYFQLFKEAYLVKRNLNFESQ